MTEQAPGAGQLAGRRALVVGAGSGIGRAVVDAFLAAGAAVATLERDDTKHRQLAELLGATAVHGDATDPADNARAVTVACAELGGLDTLVQCVGRFDFYRGIGELDVDQLTSGFEELFRVNVLSHLLSVHAALDELRRNRGSVILTASTSSFTPGRGGVLYVGTKFAVRGLIASLANELAPDVRVNGVAPGGTLGTDLRGIDAWGDAPRRLDDEVARAAALRGRTPLQVALTAADHAACYVFLASDAARGMTGRFLHPDGGMAAR